MSTAVKKKTPEQLAKEAARVRSRKFTDSVFITLTMAATVFGLVWLALILGTLTFQGLAGFSFDIFTKLTPPPGEAGGLLNAFLGTLVMSAIAIVVGTPIGILAGTYLAEYGRHGRLGFVVRFVNDILLSAPSIVIGLFVYEVLIVKIQHFSGIAGGLALSLIVIPVVVRTTENMLIQVPNSLREAAAAMGSPKSVFIRAITWRAASAGITTGVLLAVARISGETAPLLFTALNNQYWDNDLNGPMASLPVVIFQFAMSPYEEWHKLAWSGAFVVTLTVLLLSIVARVLQAPKAPRSK